MVPVSGEGGVFLQGQEKGYLSSSDYENRFAIELESKRGRGSPAVVFTASETIDDTGIKLLVIGFRNGAVIINPVRVDGQLWVQPPMGSHSAIPLEGPCSIVFIPDLIAKAPRQVGPEFCFGI